MTLIKKIKTTLRQFDMFGFPISLRYKSDNTFKTFIGGAFTILSRVAIICYFAYGLADIYNRKSSIVKKTIHKNMFIDKTALHLTKENFDVGFTININGDSLAEENLSRYMDIEYFNMKVNYTEDGTMVSNLIKTNITKCTTERFGGDQTVIDAMGLTNYYCDADMDTYIYGAQTGESNQFGLRIKQCENTTLLAYGKNYTCASKEEINKAFDKTLVTVVIMSHYFDASEFSASPIKSEFKTYIFSLAYDLGQGQDIFVQENYLYTYDSWIGTFLGSNSYTYTDVQLAKPYVGALQNGVFPQLAVYFMIANRSDETTRYVSSLIDVLSNTGGFSSVISFIAAATILKLQEQLFYGSLIKKLFRVQKKKIRKFNLIKHKTEDIESLTPKGKSLLTSVDGLTALKNSQRNNFSNKRDSLRDFLEQHSLEDYNKLNKREIATYLLHSLPERIKPKINIIKHKIKKILCCCIFWKKQSTTPKMILFQNAIKMLDEQFDIVKVMQSVRQSHLHQKIILSKFQRDLLPYFKDNLVSSRTQLNTSQDINKKKIGFHIVSKILQQKNLQNSINKMFKTDYLTKMNYKILKQLVNSDDEDENNLITDRIKRLKLLVKAKPETKKNSPILSVKEEASSSIRGIKEEFNIEDSTIKIESITKDRDRTDKQRRECVTVDVGLQQYYKSSNSDRISMDIDDQMESNQCMDGSNIGIQPPKRTQWVSNRKKHLSVIVHDNDDQQFS